MTELERLRDQLSRSWNGDAWHGPSLLDLLSGVDAATAAARPISDAHTIHEIVLHLAAWQDRVRKRLGGDSAPMTGAEDWPTPRGTGREAWRRALARLEGARAALLESVDTLDPATLDEPAAGGRYSTYVLVHGVVQHDLYHGGQIALLAKAGRTAAARG